MKKTKNLLDYILIDFEGEYVYMDCRSIINNKQFNFNTAIDLHQNKIYLSSSYMNVDYSSFCPMSEARIEWYKECINKNKILDFPLKRKENTQILPKDYIKGKYYYSKFYNGKWHEIIFKYHPEKKKNVFIQITNKSFKYGSCCTSDSFMLEDIRRLATEEEIKWLDACIKANKFLNLEEINKNNNINLDNGYYNFITESEEYIMKIANDKYYWAQKLPNASYHKTNAFFIGNNDWMKHYTITVASKEDANWLDDCIYLDRLIDRQPPNTNQLTNYNERAQLYMGLSKSFNLLVDPPKLSNNSNMPKFIKSELDELLPTPKLEIKTTKIVFINNKN